MGRRDDDLCGDVNVARRTLARRGTVSALCLAALLGDFSRLHRQRSLRNDVGSAAAKHVFLNFACSRFWKFGNEMEFTRNFEVGEMITAKESQSVSLADLAGA